jgi:hypothetical protein
VVFFLPHNSDIAAANLNLPIEAMPLEGRLRSSAAGWMEDLRCIVASRGLELSVLEAGG